MGCLSSPKIADPQEQIRLLSNLKKEVLKTIETNMIKISNAEKDIQEIDENKKQIENDLVQNQYSYSEAEKLEKAHKILELKADLERVQYSFELFNKHNKNFKDFLSMIEAKIEEMKNNGILTRQNDIMAKEENADVTPLFRKSYEDLLKQQRKDEERLKLFHYKNNEFGTADELLKQILGNGTDGVPPA